LQSTDILIITNIPAFYKINLYNELHQRTRIFVIFIAQQNSAGLYDKAFHEQIEFPFATLNKCRMERRYVLKSVISFVRIVKRIKYRRLILCGWDLPEFIIGYFISPKRKNCLEIESTILESKTSGFVAMVKRLLLKRIDIALVAGTPHQELLRVLGFRGICILTHGVGLIAKSERRRIINPKSAGDFKYLFVGRLVAEKDLQVLVKAFNVNQGDLTIVGSGPLMEELKSASRSNIKFVGFVKNYDLCKIYHAHHVLILPSRSETWGLVVEEAIYHGLPVIVSDAVGCNIEMVKKPQTGLVFQTGNCHDLSNCVSEMVNRYKYFRGMVDQFDFERRDLNQIDSYLQVLISAKEVTHHEQK
jgi:glycosyltransferase involved in cell wall biosynthesis